MRWHCYCSTINQLQRDEANREQATRYKAILKCKIYFPSEFNIGRHCMTLQLPQPNQPLYFYVFDLFDLSVYRWNIIRYVQMCSSINIYKQKNIPKANDFFLEIQEIKTQHSINIEITPLQISIGVLSARETNSWECFSKFKIRTILHFWPNNLLVSEYIPLDQRNEKRNSNQHFQLRINSVIIKCGRLNSIAAIWFWFIFQWCGLSCTWVHFK